MPLVPVSRYKPRSAVEFHHDQREAAGDFESRVDTAKEYSGFQASLRRRHQARWGSRGLLLSFIAHFLLEEISASLLAEILVSMAGIGLMTAIAYYRSWSKRLERRPRSPPGGPSDEAIRDVGKLGGAKIANRFTAADSRRRSPSVSGRAKRRTAKLTTNWSINPEESTKTASSVTKRRVGI
ncbi:OpgC domain-containing protein [Bradyrhizobium sp.]|uniref:OpgC domain-containing protein n=1 Tax=Bradyrhizobium sp. TaxID=376 RepID=UPI004037E801